MKPDLFSLIKHGAILTWKVVAILGGPIAAWLQSDSEGEPEHEPDPDVLPWDASRATDPEYIAAAVKQNVFWEHDGTYRPERVYGDFRS